MLITKNRVFSCGLILLLMVTVMQGQQGGPSSNDLNQINAQIRQLKDRIKAQQSNSPQPNLLQERTQLLMLLQQKRTLLIEARSHIAPESNQILFQVIDDSLKSVETDMQEVVEGLRTDVSLPPSSPASVPTVTPVPRAIPSPSATPAPLGEEAATAVAAAVNPPKDQAELHDCSSVNQNLGSFSQYERAVCAIVGDIQSRKRGNVDPALAGARPKATLSLAQNFLELQAIFVGKFIGTEEGERAKFLFEAEDSRTDKQVGGGPSNAGSTSLVVKGGAPSVLGFAVENGALTQTTTGTTITFRGNPIGLYKFASGTGFFNSYEEDENDPFTRFLKKTSFSVSFDANRGKQPGVFTANTQQISAYSARIEFINERDPRHRKYQTMWQKFLEDEGIIFTKDVVSTRSALIDESDPDPRKYKFRDPKIQAWFEDTAKALSEATTDGEVETKFKEQLKKLPANSAVSPNTIVTLKGFADSLGNYLNARNKILKEVAKGSVVTFEYTNNRAVNAPDTSNFRFIAETGIFKGKADLTANASLTMFNSRPLPGTKRIPDFQFSGQLDVPFGSSRELGKFIFSMAGKYQRLTGNAIALDGTVIPGLNGDIGALQAKLAVPIKGSGFKIPFSVTFANRTELVREKEIRANFGFTFDLDTLFAKFKPF
jgi:hypothetical protein